MGAAAVGGHLHRVGEVDMGEGGMTGEAMIVAILPGVVTVEGTEVDQGVMHPIEQAVIVVMLGLGVWSFNR